ncbi:MAG: hypothetical protein II972_04095 [Elusimicrobiaceae bacterium]|nr:hypothetical protein [Elusimicrobiaceae bacterium]
MKRLTAFLFCALATSLVYGQAVELSTLLPAKPSSVVDELRVLGTGTSTITEMNIGLAMPSAAVEEPLQMQTLEVSGMPTILNTISAGRDLILNEKIDLKSINIGDGKLFIRAGVFPFVKTGTFRAKDIETTATSGTMYLNALSGKDIHVDGAVLDSPFNKGSVIAKRKVVYLGSDQDSSNQNKYHIYFPWSTPSTTAPNVTPKCNNSGAICTKNNCAYCNNGSGSFCYDVRSRNLTAVYEAAGATYEKIGTAKFYCKPVDTYDNNGALTSECRHYMVYSGRNGDHIEGFTAGTGAVANPFAGVGVDVGFYESYTKTNIAEKCASLFNCSPCSAYKENLFFVLKSTQEIVKFDVIFAETCSNADASSWPAGSGLSCKAQEKVIDVYALKCYPGSGKKIRDTATYYQTRKVLCRQYSHVHAEKSEVEHIQDRYFFYPDFALTFSAAYDSETLPDTGVVVVNQGQNH